MNNAQQLKKSLGFTLLEVMVALLIIAVALLSLIKIMGMQASHLQYLEQKNLAQWAALDVVNKLQAGIIPLSTDLDTINGEENQLNTTWYWTINFETTGDPKAIKATVEIRSSETGNALIHFITYIPSTITPVNR